MAGTGWVALLSALMLLPASADGQPPAVTPPAQQAPSRQSSSPPRAPAGAEAKALAVLLDRAASMAPGTYVASGEAFFEPLPEARVPLVVQADALRGPDRSITVAVSLGADPRQPVTTRVRIVATGAPSRPVVSDVSGSSPAGVLRAIHQLTMSPGEYALLAAMAHTRSGGPVVVSLAKSHLVIPDLWHGSLSVSPLVIGDAIGAAPPEHAGTPFAFGPTALRPSAGDRFARDSDLHVAFRVVNWKATPGEKPDLLVEYVFHEQTPSRAQFFNKVKPQRLNGDTLGERFDPSSGVVHGGMSIPLAAFPFGEFRLTVRVTDNRTRQSASQQALFSVVP